MSLLQRLVGVGVRIGAGVALALAAAGSWAQASLPLPQVLLPAVGLAAQDVAVIVNDDDPASVETGAYYASQRGIAADRVIHVSFTPGRTVMSQDEFEGVQQVLRSRVPPSVQAYALAWTLPYRVDCMSVTSAFAFGFDRAYCATGCQLTKPSGYFNSNSSRPHREHGLRPAMLLAGASFDDVKSLIDRGLRAENQWPAGTGYLISTGDRNRNVRAASYDRTRRALAGGYAIERVSADELEGRRDVMFAFTGSQHLKRLRSNRYLDGAVADHLTSLGGMLTDSPQTSALEWLSAGATGSYGTVVEPCNYRQKFPDVAVVMGRYLGGETLVEAYWKSVLMPGQGVFIGDPLARPFGGVRVMRRGSQLMAQTHTLRPGKYLLQSAVSSVGPFRGIGRLVVPGYGSYDLRLPASGAPYYRLLPLP